jgi:outer membrane murein-binding lipoprotein Lpp
VIPQVYIAAAIAAASFAGGWTVEHWRLGSVIARCEAARDNLSSALKDQNAAIEAVKTAGDKVRADAAVATKRAAEAEAKAKGAEDALRAKLKAPGAPTDCKAGLAEIRAGFKP